MSYFKSSVTDVAMTMKPLTQVSWTDETALRCDVDWAQMTRRETEAIPKSVMRDRHIASEQLQLSPHVTRLAAFYETTPIVNPVVGFLESLYGLQDANAIRPGIRFIFATLTNWLSEGSYSLCDAVLEKVDVTRLGVDLLLSFLTITRSSRDQLVKRDTFLDRARAQIVAVRGQAVADKLLNDMA